MAIVSPHGSLSKEFPHHALGQTILAARAGMNMSQLKAVATKPDIAPVVCARWLQFRKGQVVRDRFLSLAEAEGLKTPRMMKIMYGVFVLRDNRIRGFILNKIADSHGRWRPAEVVRKSNADYFDGSSKSKVRSNFEFFLANAGIYAQGVIHLELEDGWLQDSVAVASQYEDDPKTRASMLADPISYIINQGWCGIANATAADLRGVTPIVQPEAENTTDSEISPPEASPAKAWNRKSPQFQGRQAASVFVNAVARERASTAHYALERLLVDAAKAVGYEAKENVNIDVFFKTPSGTVLAEIKSCNSGNLHSQTRRGISQLFEYDFLYGDSIGRPIVKALVLEMQPVSSKSWLISYLTGLGVFVCWRSPDGQSLQSTVSVPPPLKGIIDFL